VSRQRADTDKVEWKTSHNRKISGPKQAEIMVRETGGDAPEGQARSAAN